MLTILRNKDTSREDFIFFIDRLATLVVEKATEHLPYVSNTVVTPLEVESCGKKLDVSVSYDHSSSYCYLNYAVYVWDFYTTIVCLFGEQP
jgi:hypothetical protein